MNLNDPAQRPAWYQGLNRFPAPRSWHQLASDFGIKQVWLVDDEEKFSSSLTDHVHLLIHINARCEYWRNYEQFGATTPEESRVLAFLHELGHRAQQHTGSASTIVDDTGRARVVIDERGPLTPEERAAWQWAMWFRDAQPEVYHALLHDYLKWAKSHDFNNKSW